LNCVATLVKLSNLDVWCVWLIFILSWNFALDVERK